MRSPAGRSATFPEAARVLERVLKMGSAGDSPAPVGDPPTGTALSHVARRPFSLPRTVVSVPSGGSPDGTGGSAVLTGKYFSNTRLARRRAKYSRAAFRPIPAFLFFLLRASCSPPFRVFSTQSSLT